MQTISDFSEHRKNNIDFIRFIAASAVVFSHSYAIVSGENDSEPLYLLTNRQSTIGGTAVAVFFVLSGFLITQSFMRSSNMKKYMVSRLLRIFPALVFMVICTVFMIGPLMTAVPVSEYFSNLNTYRYLMNGVGYTNFSGLPGVFQSVPFANVVNGSLWTLPIEFYCYILVPAIGLVLLRKFTEAIPFIGGAILIAMTDFIPPSYFFNMLNYFACGAMFFVLRKKIAFHPLLAGLALLLIFVSAWLHVYIHTFGVLGGYLVLYAGLKPQVGLENFARHGDFSYGIYIWAFPVQQIITSLTKRPEPVFNFIYSYPVILLLAFISWHIVEKRALAYKLAIKKIE